MMRFLPLLVAAFPLSASLALAQNSPVVSVTEVSFSLAAENRDVVGNPGFQAGENRDVAFEIGRAEGRGADDSAVKRQAPQATLRVAERRTKKAFVVPWQTGVFQ